MVALLCGNGHGCHLYIASYPVLPMFFNVHKKLDSPGRFGDVIGCCLRHGYISPPTCPCSQSRGKAMSTHIAWASGRKYPIASDHIARSLSDLSSQWSPTCHSQWNSFPYYAGHTSNPCVLPVQSALSLSPSRSISLSVVLQYTQLRERGAGRGGRERERARESTQYR